MRVTRLYLSDLLDQQGLSPNLVLLQLLVSSREQTFGLSRGLLRDAETDQEFQRRLSLIETILANKFPQLTKEMIMQMLDLKQMDITQSRFYQEIITEGRQQGIEQGIERGRQEGLHEGEVNLVLRQLTRRLGVLSVEQSNQIKGLSVTQLESLGEALLEFTSIADLENVLTRLKS